MQNETKDQGSQVNWIASFPKANFIRVISSLAQSFPNSLSFRFDCYPIFLKAEFWPWNSFDFWFTYPRISTFIHIRTLIAISKMACNKKRFWLKLNFSETGKLAACLWDHPAELSSTHAGFIFYWKSWIFVSFVSRQKSEKSYRIQWE